MCQFALHREVIGRTSAALAVIVAFGACAPPSGADQAPTITHGPILGRPGSHQMGIWARTSSPGAFRVRYGRQPDGLDRGSRPVATRPEVDNSGWVHLDGLEADAEYHYQVVPEGAVARAQGPGGSFRTLPDPDEVRHPEHNPEGLFNF